MALDKPNQNKMQTADTVKVGIDSAKEGAEMTAYFFPDYQCTITAESRESALEQLRGLYPDAVIEK